jgi:hypothetical protein
MSFLNAGTFSMAPRDYPATNTVIQHVNCSITFIFCASRSGRRSLHFNFKFQISNRPTELPLPAYHTATCNQEFTFIVLGKNAKQIVVALNKATPLMAFAGQIAQQIDDHDGRIRCLRATFADLNEADANSLLKSLSDQRAKYRSLGSSDQPRVVRTVVESPDRQVSDRPTLEQESS